MFQTDQATAVSSLPPPATPGTQGFFTGGNPGSGLAATIVDADFLNMTMLELCNIVTAAGMTLSKTTYTQVLSAIRRLGQNTVVLTDTGTANAYSAVNAVPLVSGTWVDGVVQAVKIAHANTGASTYAPDGLTAIPIYGLGLQPLQGTELALNGTAILMHATIAGVNSGNPICVLMECAGGAQQIAPATASQHALQAGQALGLYLGTQVITASGTYTPGTYTVGGRNVTASKARVRMIGGGAAGGGPDATAAGNVCIALGGCSGAYAEFLIASGLASQSVTIGAAGAPASGANGGSGGNTAFGSICTCQGGVGGLGGGSGGPTGSALILNTQVNNSTPTISGTGVVAILSVAGWFPKNPGVILSTAVIYSGSGSDSPYGSGGGGQGSGVGGNATGYGAGGGGSANGVSSAARAGGSGTAGLIVVDEFA